MRIASSIKKSRMYNFVILGAFAPGFIFDLKGDIYWHLSIVEVMPIRILEKLSLVLVFVIAFIEIFQLDLGMIAVVLDLFTVAIAFSMIDQTERFLGRKSFVLSLNYLFFSTLFYFLLKDIFMYYSHSKGIMDMVINITVLSLLIFIGTTVLLLVITDIILNVPVKNDLVSIVSFIRQPKLEKPLNKEAIKDAILNLMRHSKGAFGVSLLNAFLVYTFYFTLGFLLILTMLFSPLPKYFLMIPSGIIMTIILIGKIFYDWLKARRGVKEETLILVDEGFISKLMQSSTERIAVTFMMGALFILSTYLFIWGVLLPGIGGALYGLTGRDMVFYNNFFSISFLIIVGFFNISILAKMAKNLTRFSKEERLIISGTNRSIMYFAVIYVLYVLYSFTRLLMDPTFVMMFNGLNIVLIYFLMRDQEKTSNLTDSKFLLNYFTYLLLLFSCSYALMTLIMTMFLPFKDFATILGIVVYSETVLLVNDNLILSLYIIVAITIIYSRNIIEWKKSKKYAIISDFFYTLIIALLVFVTEQIYPVVFFVHNAFIIFVLLSFIIPIMTYLSILSPEELKVHLVDDNVKIGIIRKLLECSYADYNELKHDFAEEKLDYVLSYLLALGVIKAKNIEGTPVFNVEGVYYEDLKMLVNETSRGD